MRHALVMTATVCIAVLLSILFLDRAVVALALRLVPEHHLFATAPVSFPLLPLLALAGILAGGGFALSGKPMPKWAKAALAAGVAVALSLCLVEFVLKPLFGRSVPCDYIATGTYGFAWFHGHLMQGSFPSGHSAQAAALLSVLWLYYPRGRVLWSAAFAALAAALVLGQWHYVSDIIAGGYLGAAIGLLVGRQRNWARPVG